KEFIKKIPSSLRKLDLNNHTDSRKDIIWCTTSNPNIKIVFIESGNDWRIFISSASGYMIPDNELQIRITNISTFPQPPLNFLHLIGGPKFSFSVLTEHIDQIISFIHGKDQSEFEKIRCSTLMKSLPNFYLFYH